jgi:hypothetical protein
MGNWDAHPVLNIVYFSLVPVRALYWLGIGGQPLVPPNPIFAAIQCVAIFSVAIRGFARIRRLPKMRTAVFAAVLYGVATFCTNVCPVFLK